MSDQKLTPEEVRTRGIVARAFGTHTAYPRGYHERAREALQSRERVAALQRRMDEAGARHRTREAREGRQR